MVEANGGAAATEQPAAEQPAAADAGATHDVEYATEETKGAVSEQSPFEHI